MTTLVSYKIPDLNMTVIYVNDPMIPKGVRAFFRRDPRYPKRAKMRIKDPGRVLRQSQWATIYQLMDEIARRSNYDFDELLKSAKSGY